MKSEHIYHGEPRMHADDITKLKVRISQLEEENRTLREELVRMTTTEREGIRDWRSVGW